MRTFLLAVPAFAIAGAGACDGSVLAPMIPTAQPLFGPAVAPLATLPDFPSAWSQGPVGIGQALTVGTVEVRVNELLRPADTVVTHADSYPVLERGEQFAMVDVSATCRAEAGESCTFTELNFQVSDGSGKTFYPEFAMSLAGLRGLFEGGQIPSGETWSGDVVFVVDREASAPVLTYSAFPEGRGRKPISRLGRKPPAWSTY